MLSRSAKAKGHRLEALVRDKIIEAFNLTYDDVRIAVGSENGADVKLSRKAQAKCPFSVECKNKESFKAIYTAYEQAKAHEKALIPLLILKSNNREPLVVINLDYFITMVSR